MSLEKGVWHVSRECEGIAEAGGLKDVVDGLAAALYREGIGSAVVVPRYGFIDLETLSAEKLPLAFDLMLPCRSEASEPAVETVQVYRCLRNGVPVYLVDNERTRNKRAIYTYTGEDEREDPRKKKGSGHWDAHHINLILQRGALELALALGPPDVFHCHDGHAGFLPAIMRNHGRYRNALASSRALITIHNAGSGYHQEIHDLEYACQLTGLPVEILKRGILDDAVDPLLLGALYAVVNTVSEGYAQEVASEKLDDLTGGLGAAYRRAGVDLLGITNGIAPETYDPRFPEQTGLPFRFDPPQGELEGKDRLRETLVEKIAAVRAERHSGASDQGEQDPVLAGLEIHGFLDRSYEAPLYTFIGRLTGQKGVDVLAGAISHLLETKTDLQFLILGQGERAVEEQLLCLTAGPQTAGRLCLLNGFNSLAARYLYACGDFFLVPSRYEPCGLTDLYAQMMANLPIVHAVGGLTKVRHGYSGYSYRDHTVAALVSAIEQSLSDYHSRRKQLRRMQRQAFFTVYEHYTWEKVLGERYLPLYRASNL